MSSIISSLAFFAIALAFIFLVIYLIRLSKSVQNTLEGWDEGVISKLTELEDTAQKTLGGIDQRISLLEDQLIPLIEDLRNTARAYQDLSRTLEKDLPPILDNVHQITGEIKDLTGDINVKIHQTQDLFEAAREAGQTIRVATDMSRSGLTGLAVQVASMTAGIKRSLEFLSENLRFKGGSKK
ncbi:MAG: hypothetical protein AVO38_03125 [delta proteobacterium ML8_D]|jgi:uncharacterized protein YoxC|nr:MAG: hypothetical protein AVO38_03125 [delta proteobacterium ML8_D]